jgi:hypothetical protein
MLRGTETELLHQISLHSTKLDKAILSEERAVVQKHIQELRRGMKDSAFNIFVTPAVRVVIKCFNATSVTLVPPSLRRPTNYFCQVRIHSGRSGNYLGSCFQEVSIL